MCVCVCVCIDIYICIYIYIINTPSSRIAGRRADSVQHHVWARRARRLRCTGNEQALDSLKKNSTANVEGGNPKAGIIEGG